MMSLREIALSCSPGGQLCHAPLPPRSHWFLNCASTSKIWCAPAPRRKRSFFGAASFCVLPRPTPLPTRTSLPNWAATATPSVAGGNASSPKACRDFKTPPGPVDPGPFPPDEQLYVLTLASSKTEDHQTPD